MEEAQTVTVDSMILKITRYGMRKNEDFDKYEALSLAEQLLQVAQSTKHAKCTAYNIIVETLRDKLRTPRDQFKAYYLALLAEKEYSGILDSLAKVDKLFKKKTSNGQPSQTSTTSTTSTSTASRIICWHCGIPGHRAAQCFRRGRSMQPYRRPQPLMPPSYDSNQRK